MEKSPIFDINLTLLEVENEPYLYANISNNKPLPVPKNKKILLVLDKSGSMEGENMDQCKSVLKKLLPFFQTNMPDASLNLILYDNDTEMKKDLQNKSSHALNTLIDSIEADKSTCFVNVLQAMEGYIRVQKKIEDLTIIFMTDGEIVIKEEKADDFKIIKENIQNLKEAIDSCTKECDIHTIGLGKEHDPFFLESLLAIRPINSTYLFIIDDTAIEASFEALKDMIYMNKIRCEARFVLENGKEESLKAPLVEGEEEKGLRKWQFLYKLSMIQSLKSIDVKKSIFYVTVCNGDLNESFTFESVLTKEEAVEEVSRLIKIKGDLEEMLNILKEQSKSKKWDMNSIEDLISKKKTISQKYQESFLKIYKKTKKNLFSLSGEIVSLMKLIDEMIASAYKSNIKNDVLAKAVQLAHKNIKKKKYARELFYRLKDTVPLFNAQDQEISAISKNLDPKILMEKYPNCIKDFKCCLTCYDFAEALMDQDCLCITFDVTRTEKAIVQPNSIQVNAIYPTIITAHSFLDAVKYSINLNFQNKKEQIVKGVAQESINAALPIFICPEHWSIARLLIDRVLGWIVTLDPVGYHYTQKSSFPYLLLEFALYEAYLKPESEFAKRSFYLILETCLNLMIDESLRPDSRFQQTLITLFQDYVKDGTLRTADNNNKNSLTMIKFYCAMLLGWVKPTKEYIENVFYFLVEEEFRRVQTQKFTSYLDYQKINIFDAAMSQEDKKKLIDEAFNEYNELYIKKLEIFRVLRFLMINFKQKEDIDFTQIKLEEKSPVIIELNFKDIYDFYGFYFQNQIHHENERRRRAFLLKTYFDCRQQTKEMFINYEELLKELKEKKEKLLEKFNDYSAIDLKKLSRKFRNPTVLSYLSAFRIEKDHEEAKKLLEEAVKIKPGRVVFYFLNVFYKFEEIPFLKEKLFLMSEIHGDKFKNKLRKFYIHLLCYSQILTEEEMLELFHEKNLPNIFRKK